MDPSDLVARANEERQKIFERYDLGRKVPAEPWEDPEFSVYSMTDRYGFIHEQKPPSMDDDKKTVDILVHREKKWLKMISKWDSKTTKEKLNKRIYKGIPDKLRSTVWAKLLNLETVMKDQSNLKKYDEMLQLAKQYSTEARQIDSDVNRQFREHIFYRERYNQRQKSLFNVLVAYSMYNMEVGYCQGMSTLAAMLLMYLDEEETFWALNILLTDRKYAMHGLFILGFPKLTRFLAHHDKILAKFLPKVKKHFDQCNLDSILYSLKWFFVIFVERIPFSLCLRVWDIYLLEGERVVTAMAYTVLKLHKSKLLKLKDMDAIVHYLQVKLQKDFEFDDDTVIKALEHCSEDLRKAKMDLPPVAPESEYPQNPFGVFVEPSKDEKIGHRKSDFSEIEKEVTEGVILKREQTANELANESQLTEIGLMSGSNSQLNTVQIPESEDGGSMLGSSKRSLADTSVTSTADLSIFSGAERRRSASQQNNHNDSLTANDPLNSSDIDLHNTADGEVDGESSPNSIAKSSSTIQICQKMETKSPKQSPTSSKGAKNSSATPTPTISLQDVVRIYVPPADDMLQSDKSPAFQRDRGDDEISQCSNRSSIIHVEYETLPFDRSPPHAQKQFQSPSIHENRTNKNQQQKSPTSERNETSPGAKFQPQQYYYYPHQPATQPPYQSSSSRRGSMTRKSPSPMLDTEVIVECDHMKYRRSQENINQEYSINYSANGTIPSSNKPYQSIPNNNNNVSSPMKRMTSFEELAKKNQELGDTNSLLYIHETSDNNLRKHSKPASDYSIHYNYKNLDDDQETSIVNVKQNQIKMVKKSTSHSYNFRRTERKHSSSDNNSPFDYDLLKEKRKENRFMYDDDANDGKVMETTNDNSIKSYDRFFNSDDECDDDEIRHSRVKKSSNTSYKYRSHVSGTEADDDENSSNSPPNKSIVNTPINETIPLLSGDAETTIMYQSPCPPAPITPPTNTNSLRHKSKIPRLNRSGNNNNSLRKHSSISSPDGSDRSDGYQTSINKYENRISQQSFVGVNSYQSPSFGNSGTGSSQKGENNKIRIKINQKN